MIMTKDRLALIAVVVASASFIVGNQVRSAPPEMTAISATGVSGTVTDSVGVWVMTSGGLVFCDHQIGTGMGVTPVCTKPTKP
jgi:hypothetical protein